MLSNTSFVKSCRNGPNCRWYAKGMCKFSHRHIRVSHNSQRSHTYQRRNNIILPTEIWWMIFQHILEYRSIIALVSKEWKNISWINFNQETMKALQNDPEAHERSTIKIVFADPALPFQIQNTCYKSYSDEWLLIRCLHAGCLSNVIWAYNRCIEKHSDPLRKMYFGEWYGGKYPDIMNFLMEKEVDIQYNSYCIYSEDEEDDYLITQF